MRMIWAAWVTVFFLGISQAAEFPLKCVQASKEEALDGLGGFGAIARLQAQKPSAVKHEPDAVSAHPLYGRLIVDGRQTDWVFRLDESNGDGKGYDLLILDINRNGDLRDDPQAKSENLLRPALGAYEQADFGPIAAGPTQGPWQPTLYAMALVYNRQAIAAAGDSSAFVGQLLVGSGSYLEGTVEAGGIRRKIALRDANCNLRLGDKPEVKMYSTPEGEQILAQGGDVLLCDSDGSGKFDAGDAGGESQPFSDILYVGANPYTVRLAKDFTAISLEPYSGATGELAALQNSRLARATLARKTTSDKADILVVDLTAGKVRIPVGEYRLMACFVAGETKDGARITAGGSVAGSKEWLNVTEGQSATVRAGAPIALRAEAEKRSASGSGLLRTLLGGGQTVNISARMVGAGGETYSTFMKRDKGKTVSLDPPTFKVLSLDGEELASGQLEYG